MASETADTDKPKPINKVFDSIKELTNQLHERFV